MITIPHPAPHTTRSKLKAITLDVCENPRQFTSYELAALLAYLAPQNPKKVCTDGLELAGKLTDSLLSVVRVEKGYVYNSHPKIILKAKTTADDGWYDTKTLVRSQYSAEFHAPDVFSRVRRVSPVVIDNLKSRITKSGGYYQISDASKFSKVLLDGAANSDEDTSFFIADIGEKDFVIFGENEMSSFILKAGV